MVPVYHLEAVVARLREAQEQMEELEAQLADQLEARERLEAELRVVRVARLSEEMQQAGVWPCAIGKFRNCSL